MGWVKESEEKGQGGRGGEGQPPPPPYGVHREGVRGAYIGKGREERTLGRGERSVHREGVGGAYIGKG